MTVIMDTAITLASLVPFHLAKIMKHLTPIAMGIRALQIMNAFQDFAIQTLNFAVVLLAQLLL